MEEKKIKKSKTWKIIDELNWSFNENLWRTRNTNYNSESISVLYYCASKKATKCPADLRIDYDLNKKKVLCILYDLDHSVECINSKISSSHVCSNLKIIKEKIISLHDSGVKNKRKIQELLTDDHTTVEIKKISNVLYSAKRKKSTESKQFSREELMEICKGYTFKDDNEPFILAYTIDPIRVLITHKQNLLWLHESTNIHVDATYKINIYSFPVLVIGFSDLNKKFFCSAICFCQHEDKDTLVWIFKEIKEYLRKQACVLRCQNVIGDNASAITAAVNEFDSSLLRTNCWAHIVRLIRSKAKSLKTLENEFLRDIYFMQSLTDGKVFSHLSNLLKEKYSSFICSANFIDNFFKLYMETNQNWYEAYDVFSPSTNNAIERFNLLIKQNYLMWTRSNFFDFVNISISILKDFSNKIPSLNKIVYNKEDQEPNIIKDNKLTINKMNFKLLVKKDNVHYYLVIADEENIEDMNQ